VRITPTEVHGRMFRRGASGTIEDPTQSSSD
jgi:hypothetical protein